LRSLADENFPSAAVAALKAAGDDIAWVSLTAPGAADADVLAIAVREGRVLLTFDKDFGELAARSGLPLRGRAVSAASRREPAPPAAEPRFRSWQ
jgi:predicted nuclease of predicted toxin-antitoxin system